MPKFSKVRRTVVTNILIKTTTAHGVCARDHRRHCFRKANQAPKLKPKPKHPVKVQVWTVISKRGATEVCTFEGKMDAKFYIQILENYLLPFVDSNFPSSTTVSVNVEKCQRYINHVLPKVVDVQGQATGTGTYHQL